MARANTDIVLNSFLDTDINKLCRIPIIVVYKNTSDYPERYVARLWSLQNKQHVPTKYVMIKDSIEAIRDNIPLLHRLDRSQGDDSVIVETWI